MQKIFNPTNYNWKWTEDWYNWDRKTGHSMALKARNTEAKKLKAQGYTVKKFTLKDQLISKGGIGSGNPHIEQWVSCYGLNTY